jgi:polar amino acid transport system permease protein
MRTIIRPQAVRIVIPPLGNYFVALFKDTALLSTIAVLELMFSAQVLAAQTFNYLPIYTAALILYFVISYPAALGVRYLERRLKPTGT